MASLMRSIPWLGLCFVLLLGAFSGAAVAQVSTVEGVVKGEDGQPLKDAKVVFERKDIKGKYEVKTKKKGDYLHAGLPLGTYRVLLFVNDRQRDMVDNVRTRLGEPVTINFDLHQQVAKQKAMQQAMQTGTLTEEQKREMSPEQRKAMEEQVRKNAESMKKNKALNDAFNAAMEAMKAKQYETAIQAFNQAAEIDPKQHVVWGNLAEAYAGLALSKTGADRDAAFAKAAESYQKTLELMPNDAAYYKNYAILLGRAKKLDEMEAMFTKAVQLNPAGAADYYFNMGASFVNAGNNDKACEAFKKAMEAQPAPGDVNYAEAHYQYGMACLVGKATLKPDGSMLFPEGTREVLEKYMQLRPDGVNAQSAKAILDSMGGKLETQYTAPGAKKPKPAKKR